MGVKVPQKSKAIQILEKFVCDLQLCMHFVYFSEVYLYIKMLSMYVFIF